MILLRKINMDEIIADKKKQEKFSNQCTIYYCFCKFLSTGKRQNNVECIYICSSLNKHQNKIQFDGNVGKEMSVYTLPTICCSLDDNCDSSSLVLSSFSFLTFFLNK